MRNRHHVLGVHDVQNNSSSIGYQCTIMHTVGDWGGISVGNQEAMKNDWVCDPVCGQNILFCNKWGGQGASPIVIKTDKDKWAMK